MTVTPELLAELAPHFHSPIDFGNGLISKPYLVQRRFKRRLKLLQIPADLNGKSGRDIGAWDGYFAFEFERRGAKRVVAIDKYAFGSRAIDCFKLARDYFGSKVEYHALDALDLSPEIGKFDLVFCAGLLYHLRYPLKTLEAIRSVTEGQLILETNSLIPGGHEGGPMMTFFPGDDRTIESRWNYGAFPTEGWLLAALQAAGFSKTEVIYRPSFKTLKKLAALVTNKPRRGRLIVHARV